MERIQKNGVETIKMVENAMTVMDLLRCGKEPMGVNEIAKQCSLNPSTTFRILKTLEMSGWVYQLEENDQYIIGKKIGFVTSKNNFYIALSDTAGFIMEEFTAKVGIAMNLIVRNEADCVLLQQSLTKSLVNYVPPKGTKLPYYACGGGKVLFSELPENILKRAISIRKMEPLTPYTITDENKFRQELAKVREKGYAIDFRESSINGSCIAVPVRDSDGVIIASLSFSGLTGIPSPDDLLPFLPALLEASKAITDELYFATR